MRSNGRVRGSLLILALGLLVSACIVEPETLFCACPNLETVAPTIDWMGTGQPPVTVLARSGGEGFRHRVNLHYASSEPFVDLDVAVKRLSDAGFTRSDDSNQSFRGDEWLVLLQASRRVERSLVILFVEITDDERAEEILQPLVDALGTAP